MKRTISLAVIAALFAVGAAFTTRHQAVTWNVDNPEQGNPGIYILSADQVKSIFCPGVNNIECAYATLNPNTIIKKP
jgi:hypothetical protein